MSIDALCNTTADVIKTTKASDAYGGWTETRSNRYTAMPCRIQAISGRERLMYGATRVDASHRLYCPATYSAIDAEDEISDAGGTRYRVRFVRDPDQMSHHNEVWMESIAGDIQ